MTTDGMAEGERTDGQWLCTQRFNDGNSAFSGPLPKIMTESEAREMLHSWDGNDHLRPRAGSEWWWFGAKWGGRYARWELQEDGLFHLIYDGPCEATDDHG